MRIAFFTDTYLPAVDGVVTSLRSTKSQLEAMGHDVMVIAPKHRGAPKEQGTWYVWAKQFKRYPQYALAFLPSRESAKLREFDADLVHSHGITFMAVKAMWAGWQLELPVAQTWHTMINDALPYYSPFELNERFLQKGLHVFLRRYLRKCDEVIAPTKTILKEIFTFAPEIRRHRVIPAGVDTQAFHPGIDGNWVREKWGSDGGQMVLHVGRISPEKNLPVLFAAMAAIRREVPDAKLVVVGTGPSLREYRTLVTRMGMQDTIHFAGYVRQEELPAYYAACDTFATPSTFETQGLVCLEAMASGKPVAGANARAIPEYVKEGVTGHLFTPNSSLSAADAILKCLKGDAFPEACRETAEMYSIPKCTERLVGAYRSLLEDWKSGVMPHGTGHLFG